MTTDEQTSIEKEIAWWRRYQASGRIGYVASLAIYALNIFFVSYCIANYFYGRTSPSWPDLWLIVNVVSTWFIVRSLLDIRRLQSIARRKVRSLDGYLRSLEIGNAEQVEAAVVDYEKTVQEIKALVLK